VYISLGVIKSFKEIISYYRYDGNEKENNRKKCGKISIEQMDLEYNFYWQKNKRKRIRKKQLHYQGICYKEKLPTFT
jgi:hypothetical protein